jgi:3-deoxy-D-arabino-heptulosonate 7-phosphate (DAHP) synthase
MEKFGRYPSGTMDSESAGNRTRVGRNHREMASARDTPTPLNHITAGFVAFLIVFFFWLLDAAAPLHIWLDHGTSFNIESNTKQKGINRFTVL